MTKRDKQPTQEQIKEFWERCELRWFWNHNPDCKCGAKDDDGNDRSWHYKDSNEWKLATRFWHEDMVIDLNNLFKYAVPKLDQAQYYKCLSSIFLKQKDPALALFWAIWEVIKS